MGICEFDTNLIEGTKTTQTHAQNYKIKIEINGNGVATSSQSMHDLSNSFNSNI